MTGNGAALIASGDLAALIASGDLAALIASGEDASAVRNGDGYRADLATVMAGRVPAFALLYRPQSALPDRVEILVGDVRVVDRLADLALPPVRPGADRHDLLALLPYRQIAERGFACHDDGTPLIALEVRAQGDVSMADALDALPDDDVDLVGGDFDVSDDDYAAIVRRVLADEIGRGEGSNFVIRRTFVATIANHSTQTSLATFRRLLGLELGTYWTFIVRCGGRTLIGATPERHVSLLDGTAVMNPISGTYRYPAGGPSLAGLVRFLADRKEAEELYMVVDEELKMMAQVCDLGGRLVGPRLKEMARLAHTEYLIEGRTGLDVRQILRNTMFAPTVTGSPLESACRVIARHERTGRGYYGGALALIGQHDGRRRLDASILIRTADISPDGHLEIGAGATLVRHSDPDSEVAETRAKVAGLVAALGRSDGTGAGRTGAGPRPTLSADGRVRRALAARNDGLARFWLEPAGSRGTRVAELTRRRVLVLDAEDAFTAMLAHQLRALGASVTIARFDHRWRAQDYDAVIVGPGPGDPRDAHDPKIAALRAVTTRLIVARVPFLSVCLGHQILAAVLGLPLLRKEVPSQGVQREIDFFGRAERVGFYNTFAAYSDADTLACGLVGDTVEVGRDPTTGEVYGLRMRAARSVRFRSARFRSARFRSAQFRSAQFRSVQFHVESVLTEHGPAILSELLTSMLGDRPRTGRRRSGTT